METEFPRPESPSSLYKHQELRQNQIRLLTTKWINGSIEIDIDQYTLTEDLDYDAISYVWGSAPASVTVKCNGRPLVVTSTALEMLNYLHRYQKNTTARKMWIDAICINQDDEQEKAAQIPLMREIYSKARAVVVWMGLPTPETVLFFAKFQEMRVKLKTWKAKHDVDPNCPDPAIEERPRREAFWAGMSWLLENEWFKRLWTYQEIILPSTATLLCGVLWTDFDEFSHFLMDGFFKSTYILRISPIEFTANSNATARSCGSVKYHRDRNAGNGHAKEIEVHNIGTGLNNLRERRVKEPVDRVWAIVGLLERDLRDRLSSRADYGAKGRNEYWKTWIMFAKALMDEHGGMRLLHIPPTRELKSPHLPSWCPSLHGRSACRMAIDAGWNTATDRKQSNDRWALFEENSSEKSRARRGAILNDDRSFISTVMDANVLRVRGFVVDTIEEVVEHEHPLDVAHSRYDQDLEEHMTLYHAAVDCHLKNLELARYVFYGNNEGVTDIPEDFIASLFFDERIKESAKDTYRRCLPKLKTWYSDPIRHLWEEEQCQTQITYTRGHAFFSTKGGRIGYAHPGCRPGDQIAVFYGGEPLYIIRDLDTKSDEDDKTRGASDHVQYLGPAFIPHLMEQHQRDAAHIRPDTIFFIHWNLSSSPHELQATANPLQRHRASN
ncbi:unnamed protein product [Alternaria alternata]